MSRKYFQNNIAEHDFMLALLKQNNHSYGKQCTELL